MMQIELVDSILVCLAIQVPFKIIFNIVLLFLTCHNFFLNHNVKPLNVVNVIF